jgi:hypothetical protein
MFNWFNWSNKKQVDYIITKEEYIESGFFSHLKRQVDCKLPFFSRKTKKINDKKYIVFGESSKKIDNVLWEFHFLLEYVDFMDALDTHLHHQFWISNSPDIVHIFLIFGGGKVLPVVQLTELDSGESNQVETIATATILCDT